MGQSSCSHRTSIASARCSLDYFPHLVSEGAKLGGRVRVIVGDQQIEYLAVPMNQLFNAPQPLRQVQSHVWNVATDSVGHEMSVLQMIQDESRVLCRGVSI